MSSNPKNFALKFQSNLCLKKTFTDRGSEDRMKLCGLYSENSKMNISCTGVTVAQGNPLPPPSPRRIHVHVQCTEK